MTIIQFMANTPNFMILLIISGVLMFNPRMTSWVFSSWGGSLAELECLHYSGHIGVHWCTSVYIGVQRYTLVWIGVQWCTMGNVGGHRSTLVYTDLVYINVRWCILKYKCNWCTLVHIDWCTMYIIDGEHRCTWTIDFYIDYFIMYTNIADIFFVT